MTGNLSFWSCLSCLLIVISARCNTVVFQGKNFWALPSCRCFELLACFGFSVCRYPTSFIFLPFLPTSSHPRPSPLATVCHSPPASGSGKGKSRACSGLGQGWKLLFFLFPVSLFLLSFGVHLFLFRPPLGLKKKPFFKALAATPHCPTHILLVHTHTYTLLDIFFLSPVVRGRQKRNTEHGPSIRGG